MCVRYYVQHIMVKVRSYDASKAKCRQYFEQNNNTILNKKVILALLENSIILIEWQPHRSLYNYNFLYSHDLLYVSLAELETATLVSLNHFLHISTISYKGTVLRQLLLKSIDFNIVFFKGIDIYVSQSDSLIAMPQMALR